MSYLSYGGGAYFLAPGGKPPYTLLSVFFTVIVVVCCYSFFTCKSEGLGRRGYEAEEGFSVCF